MSNQASLGDVSESETHSDSEDEGNQEWKEEKLGNLAVYQNGNSFSKGQWSDKGYPIIRIQNLTGEQEEYNHFDGNLDEKYRVEDGDILLSWSGTIALFEWQGEDAALNQHIHRIDTEDGTNDIFFKFKLEGAIPRLIALSHGSTMKHVRKADLVNLDVEIPSDIDEQRRIASVLYNVDQAISKTEEIIEQTQRVKKGLMQDMILKGVDQVGEIQELDESPVEDRELVKLGEVMTLEYGENLPEDDRNEGGVPVYGSNGPVDEHDETYVEKEGIVIGRKGTIGGAVYSDTAFWPIDTTYYITEDETELNLKFLYYLINSLQLDRLNAASAIPGLNRNDAYGLKALVPDEETQAEIVEQLEAMDDLIEKKETEKEQFQRLKKGLMQDLLTGSVRTGEDVQVLDEVVV